jgi:hypothetical protein
MRIGGSPAERVRLKDTEQVITAGVLTGQTPVTGDSIPCYALDNSLFHLGALTGHWKKLSGSEGYGRRVVSPLE